LSVAAIKAGAELHLMILDKMVELKLTIERVQTAIAERDQSGLRFVRMISFTVAETVTTDRMLVTDEAVRCLNPPST
jgi:hypothetical protein